MTDTPSSALDSLTRYHADGTRCTHAHCDEDIMFEELELTPLISFLEARIRELVAIAAEARTAARVLKAAWQHDSWPPSKSLQIVVAWGSEENDILLKAHREAGR